MRSYILKTISFFCSTLKFVCFWQTILYLKINKFKFLLSFPYQFLYSVFLNIHKYFFSLMCAENTIYIIYFNFFAFKRSITTLVNINDSYYLRINTKNILLLFNYKYNINMCIQFISKSIINQICYFMWFLFRVCLFYITSTIEIYIL